MLVLKSRKAFASGAIVPALIAGLLVGPTTAANASTVPQVASSSLVASSSPLLHQLRARNTGSPCSSRSRRSRLV